MGLFFSSCCKPHGCHARTFRCPSLTPPFDLSTNEQLLSFARTRFAKPKKYDPLKIKFSACALSVSLARLSVELHPFHNNIACRGGGGDFGSRGEGGDQGRRLRGEISGPLLHRARPSHRLAQRKEGEWECMGQITTVFASYTKQVLQSKRLNFLVRGWLSCSRPKLLADF